MILARYSSTLSLAALVACSDATVTSDAGPGDAADAGFVDTSDGNACAAPRPVCTLGGALADCCTQATACGVCFGDGLVAQTCVDGAWVCPRGWMPQTECVSTWLPDGGGLPACEYSGTMTAVLSGYAFSATVSVSVADDWSLSGRWHSSADPFPDWSGALRGFVDGDRTLRCTTISGQTFDASCVDFTGPIHLTHAGELLGSLGPAGGQGTWRVEIQAAFGPDGGILPNGEGTWALAR